MTDIELPDLEVGRHALRTFSVRNNHLWPVAMTEDDSWADGTCVARCVETSYSSLRHAILDDSPARHPTPSMDCSCGIYGTLSLIHLRTQYPVMTDRLVCVIAVEGNTILGDRGLRAAAARVVAYWAKDRGIHRIAQGQLKDGMHYKKLKKMLDAYGLPILRQEEKSGIQQPA